MFGRALVVMTMVVATLGLSGCCAAIGSIRGNGRMVTKTPSVRDFDRVELTGSGDLVIVQSGETSVSYTVDENLAQYIQAEVRAGTLYLGWNKKARMRRLRPVRGPHFEVSAPMLEHIGCSGSGEIDARRLEVEDLTVVVSGSGNVGLGEVEARDIEVRVSGSGNVRVDALNADDVAVGLSGSGGARLDGRADRQRVTVSGSGRYDGDRLESRSADVRASGSGDADLWVTDALDVTLTGSGNVAYYGEPEVTQQKSGSGTLRALGRR